MSTYKSVDEKYTKWIVKEYQYWVLLVHDDQRYLGRAYVWLVREGGMQKFSEITDEESSELRTALREYETALAKLWQSDFMNYAWLANLFNEHGGHGHMHLIPRYKNERTFADTTFTDGRWGMNYAPYEKYLPSEEVLIQISDALKSAIA